jgi:hypothetical protein
MKFFNIGSDDKAYASVGKERPILLLKKIDSTWSNPSGRAFGKWSVLPIFSYKERHDKIKDYISDDFAFKNSDHIFFPPLYEDKPGMPKASCGLLETIQSIPERNIQPYSFEGSGKYLKLHVESFNIIKYRIAKYLDIEINEPDLYKEFQESLEYFINELSK